MRFHPKIEIRNTDECWPWTGSLTNSGYGKTSRGGKTLLAHRVAYEDVNGQIPDQLQVLHRCDNPPCCNPAHLFLGTQADNLADCRAKGRTVVRRGSEHWAAKITEDQVREIRRLCSSGTTQRAVAQRFGINQSQISRLLRGEAWNHV